MNQDDFSALLERRISRIKNVLGAKAKEYSSDTDRLYNFKRAAEIERKTPEAALWGMLMKHIVSVIDIIDALPEKQPNWKTIDEKLGDIINYVILLEGLLTERIGTLLIEDIQSRADMEAANLKAQLSFPEVGKDEKKLKNKRR